MANATDFIASVYDTLAQTFNIENTSRSMFLQLAWPGISLSPLDFKDDSGQYNANVAEETFSALANIEPTFNKLKFENSGFEIDDLYEMIILGALPYSESNAIEEEDLPANPLYKLFNNAQYDFLSAQRGSINDPNLFYYKCLATPSNWYDEKASSFWTNIHLKSTDVKPVRPNSPFLRLGGDRLVGQGVWKIHPHKSVADLHTQINQTIQLDRIKLSQKFPHLAVNVATPNVLTANAQQAISMTGVGRGVAATAGVMQTNVFRNNLLTVNQSILRKKLTPINVYEKRADVLRDLKSAEVDKDKLRIRPGTMSAQNAFFLNDILVKNLPVKPASPKTNGYSISFKYCQVNISRPWLKLALLSNPAWYMYGTDSGEYSNGSVTNNPGMFSLLPLSFIVIDDLKITANWSEEDKKSLNEAVSYGPFDIRNGSFNQNTITVKGKQIIGYTSKVMPKLPPKET